MEGKLCVLFFVLFVASLCSAQATGVVTLKLTNIQLLTAENTILTAANDYRKTVFLGKEGAAGGTFAGFFEYRFDADGALREAETATKKLVKEEDLNLSNLRVAVTNDLSGLFGSTSNCGTAGNIRFGRVVQMPTKQDANLNFQNHFRFSVFVRKDLFCSFQITGLSGAYGSNSIDVPSADRRTIAVSTFKDFRYAVIPSVPSSQASITAGGASDRAKCGTDERIIEWQVYTNHAIAQGAAAPNVIPPVTFPAIAGLQCCNFQANAAGPDDDTCACNAGLQSEAACQSVSLPNAGDLNFRTQFIYRQRFTKESTQIQTTITDGVPTEATRRGLNFAAITEVTAVTQALTYAGAAANVGTVPIRLTTVDGAQASRPITDARYVVRNDALKLVTANNLVPKTARADNQAPIVDLEVKFNKPVTFFRYNKEFFVRALSPATAVISNAAFQQEFNTRYNVSSTPSPDGKTWTIKFDPSIKAPGKYNVYVVTQCTGNCLTNSLYRVAYDKVVPIPTSLTLTAPGERPAGWLGDTLNGDADASLPNGLRAEGRQFEKATKCVAPLRTCNSVCAWLSESQCRDCNACAVGEGCLPAQAADDKINVAGGQPSCIDPNQNANKFTGDGATVTEATLVNNLRFDTNPTSDPRAGNVRIFPFQCPAGNTPEFCTETRNIASLWSNAPNLLTNQIYVVNRRVRFTLRGVDRLRFNLWSWMCTKKAEVLADGTSRAHLSNDKLMYVRSPSPQRNRKFFQGVAYSEATAFDVEFWSLRSSKCEVDTYSPLVIDLLQGSKKRGLANLEATLADHPQISGNRDQIQIRAEEADDLDLDMDREAPVIRRAKCSGDGIEIVCYFQLNKPGRVVVTVLPEFPAAIEPTLPKIVAGQNAAGAMAPHVSINCPSPTQECSGQVSGLEGSTKYTAYYVAFDTNNEPNVQDTVGKVPFTTSSLASTPDSVAVTSNFRNMVSVN